MRYLRKAALLTVFSWVALGAYGETVVLINSYHPGFPWSDGMVEGIRSGLEEGGRPIELYVEYLDTKRRGYSEESEYIRKLADLLQVKYADSAVDLVMTTDDNALAFYLDSGHQLFPEVPVVFAGVNHIDNHRVAGNRLITGVTETDNHSRSVELILSLHPDIETIYVLTDATTSGKGNRTKLEELADLWNDRVEFEFLSSASGLTFEALLLKLRGLPPRSVVLYRDFFVDSAGGYIQPHRMMNLVSAASPVPVYSFGDMYLGHGIVGGVITSSKRHGEVAAKLANYVLDGVPPSGIPIQRDEVGEPVFDYRQLRRFGIPQTDLPRGSRVIGKPRSLVHDYTAPFWLMVLSILGLAALSMVLGISVRKLRKIRAENVDARNFLHATLASMGEGLLTVDAEGRITDMNHAAEKLTGTQLADALGRKLHSILEAHGGQCDHDVDCLLESIVQLEGPLESNDEEYFEPKDGSRRRLSYSGSPIRGREEPLGVVLTLRDVTEDHRVLRELEQNERHLFRSQSVAHVGSWELDPDRRMIWGSAEFYRILGVEAGEPQIGVGFFTALVAQEDRDRLVDALSVTAAEGAPLEHDLRIIRASDHEVRFLKLRGERGANGRVLVFGTIQDITESKITQARLEDSIAEKEVLLREVHHRVKNNMQVISSLINLQHGHAGEKSVDDLLMDSQNRIRSMALIHDMLYQSETFSEIDLEPYLRSLAVTLFDAYNVGHRGVTMHFATRSVMVDLDRAIPCGLMTNEIVSNSLKYAFDAGGTISVSLRKRNRSVVLEIRDDGCGLPEDVGPGRGASLGMQLIATLADQLQAQISVDRHEGTAWYIEFEA